MIERLRRLRWRLGWLTRRERAYLSIVGKSIAAQPVRVYRRAEDGSRTLLMPQQAAALGIMDCLKQDPRGHRSLS
jgi:hypothetical protein